MSQSSDEPVFIGGRDDPARASPVGDEEYSRLVAAMDGVLMPAVTQAARLLEMIGFTVARAERRGGMASLVVQRADPQMDGWLRFQIHRSFGPLLSGERIFWMFTVFDARGRIAGKPGRLPDFNDSAAINEIVSDFLNACITAPGPSAITLPAVLAILPPVLADQ